METLSSMSPNNPDSKVRAFFIKHFVLCYITKLFGIQVTFKRNSVFLVPSLLLNIFVFIECELIMTLYTLGASILLLFLIQGYVISMRPIGYDELSNDQKLSYLSYKEDGIVGVYDQKELDDLKTSIENAKHYKPYLFLCLPNVQAIIMLVMLALYHIFNK